MQTEIHTAEPLVLGPSAFNFEMATGRTKRHKSTVSDRFQADLNKAGVRRIRNEIQNRTHYKQITAHIALQLQNLLVYIMLNES
jgi:ABC-type ATPase with predicted acetyltransferase domain